MNDLDSLIGYKLARLMRLHRSRAEAELNALGLYPGQEVLLLRLDQDDGQTQGQLADRLNVEPPTLTRMLQRMERNDLIERRSDPEDARVSRVYLTEQSRALIPKVYTIWRDLDRQMLSGISDIERALLERVLAQMTDHLT